MRAGSNSNSRSESCVKGIVVYTKAAEAGGVKSESKRGGAPKAKAARSKVDINRAKRKRCPPAHRLTGII